MGINRKIVVLWDNIPPHKANCVAEFIHKHRNRLAAFFTPPYAPEYNPDEGVWTQMKYHDMANFCPRDEAELKTEIRYSIMRLRSRPKVVRGFFRRSPLGL